MNKPTTHTVIATTLTNICGLFATRYAQIAKQRPPSSPQIGSKPNSRKKFISTYIARMKNVPVHCMILFTFSLFMLYYNSKTNLCQLKKNGQLSPFVSICLHSFFTSHDQPYCYIVTDFIIVKVKCDKSRSMIATMKLYFSFAVVAFIV